VQQRTFAAKDIVEAELPLSRDPERQQRGTRNQARGGDWSRAVLSESVKRLNGATRAGQGMMVRGSSLGDNV